MVLGAQDLGRTRLVVSPLQNLIIGFWGHQPSRERIQWQRAARRRVCRTSAPLLELINAHPWYVPDFLTPILSTAGNTPSSGIAEELDALRAVSDAQIHADLAPLHALPDVPRSVLNLRETGARQVARIVDAARALFASCLAEDWPAMRQRLRADVAHRGAQMAASGSGSTLTGLSPRLTWRDADTLTVALGACERRSGRAEVSVELSGQGLLLVPSPFAGPGTVVITGSVTASRQAVLAYPAIHGPAPAAAGRDVDALAALVGRGRARALRAVHGTATTGELAHRLGIGVSSASEHASALRAAGLVTTYRTGRHVHHTVTDLGRRLLADGGPVQLP